ncbi:sugar ABC transporter ATP-binding protein [Paracoccus sp. R12_1]|uniref:sugar ABC transporter ATP-binding protein n=1 Tax=unclassified Paracoccus (in: a-proteobacteria) TaxID=2688777 RepID=UPI001ADC6574|nr:MULTISPECIES: sugar ABC transporter ATP-binding protein [unclassified Paracoccus (in: a-proteobacteria)]MBO9455007.1 sugar ABC transporter ATP-binding protein [Paracoccus sp. R12_2]MBO9485305.1 sugar ABC transporter ATP-binding protein [Paracoccus sp. R12_1]
MAYLEARGLGRDFPGVTALNEVDLSVELGRTHILAGENGAGKSTLVKILTGSDRATRGSIAIDGQDPLDHPDLFRNIAYVPQELSLFADVSVAENLFMPFDRTGHGGIVNRRHMEAEAQTYLDRFGIDAKPSDLVRHISVPDQQLLQIARASTNQDMKVLILDEPTSALTAREVQRVFKVIRGFLDRDHAIVFISHKMEEVFEIGDDYTVLRNGKKVDAGRVTEIDEPGLIRAMSGREVAIDQHFRPACPVTDTVMTVENLSGHMFDDVSFDLKRGEILGLAGLVGAGRSELMQSIFGFRKATAGRVQVEGRDWRLHDTASSVAGGMLYLSEERKQHGIFPLLSLRENIGLSVLSLTSGAAGIDFGMERGLVRRVIDDYGIKASGPGQRISNLSGGNQQKAIIGRAMATTPRILIFDEPTKGIDIRTKAEIYRIMKQLAEDGVGIILISSEMTELRRCASRILTMHGGRITGDFDAATTDTETLVGAIFATGTGSEQAREDAEASHVH